MCSRWWPDSCLFLAGVPRSNCRSEPARDSVLTANPYLTDPPGSNCRSEPARDSGLIGGEILDGVHIHSCGHGFYWFRPYGESLSKSAKVTKALLPLSSGASPGLGISSLRSCSVGPPRSAIHGRARLTRHPCRVSHCAEPALGLPMGQEDQKPKRGGLTADLTFEAHAFSCGSWLASDGALTADPFLRMYPNQMVGAGLPAMAA